MSNQASNEVGMSECRTTRTRLFTEGASTCIILAALNLETKTGLLGHLSYPQDAELFEESVEAITNIGPAENTQILLAGGGIYFSDGVSYPEAAEHNKTVEERVKAMAQKHGIPLSAITVSWLWGNDEANTEVNCIEGKITVQEQLGRISLLLN